MAAHRTASTNPAPAIAYLVSAVVLAILAGVAYIVLRDDDDTRSGLMLIALPFITGLLTAAKVDHVTAQQNVTLGKIEHQTNGVLAQKIRAEVTAVLDARDAQRALTIDAVQTAQGPAVAPEVI